MLGEIKKALTVKRHAGVSSNMTLPVLARSAAPYFLSRAGSARPPLTVYWSINSVCNLSCKMCDVGMQVAESNFFKNLRLDASRDEIEIEVFQKVIDEVAEFKPMIAITSTEPLIYRPLPQAIEHTVKRGLQVAVTTGGYNLQSRAEELVDAGLTRLTISIDGPPHIHNEIRGRKDSFERATQGLARFKELSQARGRQVDALINYTVTNHNYFCLADFMKSIEGLPVDVVNVSLMSFVDEKMAKLHNQDYGDQYNATVNCMAGGTDPTAVDVEVLKAELGILRRDFAHRAMTLPEQSDSQLEVYFKDSLSFINANRCMVSWFIAQIIANGDVIPYTRCYNIPLGNVREQPFMEIWNGPVMRAWRQDLRGHKKFPACTRCDQCY